MQPALDVLKVGLDNNRYGRTHRSGWLKPVADRRSGHNELARNPEIAAWLEHLLEAGVGVVIPEIVDYELRRSFLLEGLTRSLARLDALGEALAFQPINTATMRRAAELWAEARRRGQSTADPKELDGDDILAAQAWQLGATVATENVGHLGQFVPAFKWQEITAD